MLDNLSRRQSLQNLAVFGLGAAVAAPIRPESALAQPAPSDIKDEDIFQFALNLGGGRRLQPRRGQRRPKS